MKQDILVEVYRKLIHCSSILLPTGYMYIIKDQDILELARQDAKSLITNDPQLRHTDNQEIKNEYIKLNKDSILWKHIS